jgi:hypothetical protein
MARPVHCQHPRFGTEETACGKEQYLNKKEKPALLISDGGAAITCTACLRWLADHAQFYNQLKAKGYKTFAQRKPKRGRKSHSKQMSFYLEK